MKSTWNDGNGNRVRYPVAVLVTADGQPHRFTGESIPGVCQSTQTGGDHNGKWSSRDFVVLHHDTTSFISWRQDWDTGESWPHLSWDEGFRWLASKAPAIKRGNFDAFIRANFPKAAEKWDARKLAGEAECGKPSTAEQLAAIEAGKLEIARLNAEADAVAGLDPETLNAETDALWLEVRHMEEKLSSARRKAEAENKKAELCNSIGNAFAALGL